MTNNTEHEELLDDGSEELEDVEAGSEEQPEQPEAKEAKEGKEEKSALKAIRLELKELKGAISERDRALEYWRGKAEGKGTANSSAEGDDDEEDVKLDDDLVDAISSNDPKRISKALKSLGFVREKDVQRTIAGTRAAMTREAKLVSEFPELNDEKSPFYEATKKHYADLVADDPSLKQSPATLRMAAKLAKAELESGEGEESRASRISRQSGGRQVRRSSSQSGGSAEGSEELSPVQKRIIANLRDAGAKIDEAGYKKRAASGVRMGGVKRGR